MSEAVLSKWLNQKIEPVYMPFPHQTNSFSLATTMAPRLRVLCSRTLTMQCRHFRYAYMTGQLKMVGDQKAVIKLNALKPLFSEACSAATQPVSREDSAARAADEAEWAQYQAEERKRAEEFAKILEQEAAERRARKEEEQRIARLRAISEAESFAKAASEDLCWDIVTDSEKAKAVAEEVKRKEDAEHARLDAEKNRLKNAAKRAQQVRAALEIDPESATTEGELFRPGGGCDTPNSRASKLNLDDLFAAVEEESENQKRAREDREAAEREILEAAEQVRLEEQAAVEKIKAERQAKLQADWKQVHADTQVEAALLKEQRVQEALERASTRKAKAEMNSRFGFTVEPISIFDDVEVHQETPVKASNQVEDVSGGRSAAHDIFGGESDEEESSLSLSRAHHRKLKKGDIPRQPKLQPKAVPKKAAELDKEAHIRAIEQKKEGELRLQEKEARVAAEAAAAKVAKESKRKKKLAGFDGKSASAVFGDDEDDERFTF